jgi:MFS superfamily sulfate permease-like transporter
MEIAHGVLSMVVVVPGSWRADWAWGLPLIVLTVVIHVLGLGLVAQRAVGLSSRMMERRHPTVVFVSVVGATTLFATCLHALEASIWASAYWLLGAMPDERNAMLYSLSAITSYGHETLQLQERWQLMGSLEALNGWLLFGLSTAFLFGMIEKVWTLGNKERLR